MPLPARAAWALSSAGHEALSQFSAKARNKEFYQKLTKNVAGENASRPGQHSGSGFGVLSHGSPRAAQ